jgi:hypothetical protein
VTVPVKRMVCILTFLMMMMMSDDPVRDKRALERSTRFRCDEDDPPNPMTLWINSMVLIQYISRTCHCIQIEKNIPVHIIHKFIITKITY